MKAKKRSLLRTAVVAYALFWATSIAIGRASKLQV